MTSNQSASTPTAASNAVQIRAATVADVPHLTELLTAAFLISPVGDWLIGDLATRQAAYRRYFRIHVEHALHHGLIHITRAGDGVAVWFPRDGHADDPDDYQQRLADACGTWLRRFEIIDEVFEHHHPTHQHHYLAFIGVHPDRQREGIGSALLAHHTTVLDNRQLPAYLEASTPHSRDLYQRHGYRVVTTGPITLPEDGPPIWPMSRTPTPPALPPCPTTSRSSVATPPMGTS